MRAGENGINNFSEMSNSPITRRNTKSHQGTAKKRATNSLRGKVKIESNPTGLSDDQGGSARRAILKNPIVYITE